MPEVTDVLDTLLRLGEEISEAMAADDWSRVDDLVERRTEAAQTLGDDGEPSAHADLSGTEQKKKVEALADQNQHLMDLLRKQRDEIEDELTQIGQMRNAQDSYDTGSSRSGALPSELSG